MCKQFFSQLLKFLLTDLLRLHRFTIMNYGSLCRSAAKELLSVDVSRAVCGMDLNFYGMTLFLAVFRIFKKSFVIDEFCI